jgi:hypothetical protein
MGSKEKFWYRAKDGEPEWLFKFPQPNTGQHWSETFARDGRDLFHGNQMLAGKVLGYDPAKQFRQSDHTLENILTAIDRTFTTLEGARKAKLRMSEYIVLDAVIGNTDRHHENWGITRKRVGERWQGMLAPTFDHASSLGRELVDVSEGKCRQRILQAGRVGAYAEKAPGAIFWDKADKRGLSPLELVRRAALLHPDLFRPALARLERLSRPKLAAIVARVPEDWMSPMAREFAIELMCYNSEELSKLTP